DGKRANLDLWIQGLRDFARDTQFMKWFDKNVKLLDADVDGFRKKIASQDYINKLEAYTGLPFEGVYIFYLSPFVDNYAGANVVSRLEDGSAHIISVLGPNDEMKDGKLTYYFNELPPRIYHEAAH